MYNPYNHLNSDLNSMRQFVFFIFLYYYKFFASIPRIIRVCLFFTSTVPAFDLRVGHGWQSLGSNGHFLVLGPWYQCSLKKVLAQNLQTFIQNGKTEDDDTGPDHSYNTLQNIQIGVSLRIVPLYYCNNAD